MNASGGAEGVAAHDGIVRRNHRVRRLRDGLRILLQLRKVTVDHAEQAQIHEHQFHRRIAYALAERERCRVYLIRAARR